MLRKPYKKKRDGINHFLLDFVGPGDTLELENGTFNESGINAKKYNISMTLPLCELWIFDLIIFYTI